MLSWKAGEGGASSEGCRKQGRSASTESVALRLLFVRPLGLFNPLNVGTSLRDAPQTLSAVCRISEKDVLQYKPVEGAVTQLHIFNEFKRRFCGHKHTVALATNKEQRFL
jgi:hypothetical protein